MKIIAISLVVLILAGCKEYHDFEDTSGNLHISGRAFYIEDIESNGEFKVFAGKKIKIKEEGKDDELFLFSAQTDSAGYFRLNNVKSNVSYTLFSDEEIGGVKYYNTKSLRITESVDTITLILTTSPRKQNGFVYTLKDSLNPQGVITNATICVFTSAVLALPPDTCTGSSFSITTNSYGKASKLNIPAGRYITFSRVVGNGIILTARDTIDVPAEGIIRKQLILKK